MLGKREYTVGPANLVHLKDNDKVGPSRYFLCSLERVVLVEKRRTTFCTHGGGIEFVVKFLFSRRPEVIDEDGSGDVSLTEFLDSKVLRVKSLFDRFDTDRSRTVSQSEMVAILQSISPAITVDEAAALYHSANLKGAFDLSFNWPRDSCHERRQQFQTTNDRPPNFNDDASS